MVKFFLVREMFFVVLNMEKWCENKRGEGVGYMGKKVFLLISIL